MVSACGLICTECPFFNNPCQGCYIVEGKTFWAVDHLPEKVCPLFDCSVNQRGLKDCGECNELPCKKYYDLRDPSIHEEEHLAVINRRVEVLRKI